MRITNDRPFIGAGPDLFVVDDLGDALHKIAGINACPENFGNRARLPIPISDQILMGNLAQPFLIVTWGEDPGFNRTAMVFRPSPSAAH